MFLRCVNLDFENIDSDVVVWLVLMRIGFVCVRTPNQHEQKLCIVLSVNLFPMALFCVVKPSLQLQTAHLIWWLIEVGKCFNLGSHLWMGGIWKFLQGVDCKHPHLQPRIIELKEQLWIKLKFKLAINIVKNIHLFWTVLRGSTMQIYVFEREIDGCKF